MTARCPAEPKNAEEARRMGRILESAEFIGFQSDFQGGGFDLFNLTKPLGIYPKGSTLTRQTLERLLFS
jgi:hypothetical protein